MPEADLVLEGGGVKGIALVGAVSALMERGYEFKRVAGTSAGSIVGALVAARFPQKELESIVRSIDYRKFQDGSRWDDTVVGKVVDLLRHSGVYAGDYLRSWLAEQLAKKEVHTFADLRYQDDTAPLPENKQYRLVVNTSDISAGRLRQLPWAYDFYGKRADETPVADAVRCSMSIPFFYAPVQLRTANGDVHWMVDGGMLSNFPIDLFDSPPEVVPRWPTFGIKLSSRPGAVQNAMVNEVKNPVSMSLALLNTMTGFYDRMHIDDESVIARTIFVDTGHIKATDFGLSSDDRDTLYNNGRQAAINFLDGPPGWDFEAYKAKYRIPPP